MIPSSAPRTDNTHYLFTGPKCFDGSGRLENFLPTSAGERVLITGAHLDAATGYFLHDCARLRKVDVAERYMILVVDRREPTDKLGTALLAAKLSEHEWTSEENPKYLVRVWAV